MLRADRLKSFVVLIVAGFMGGVVSRAVPDMIPRVSAQREKVEQVVKAHNFELLDNQNRVRAALYMLEAPSFSQEGPRLILYDTKKLPLISLQTDTRFAPYSRISLSSPQKHNSISLSASETEASLSAGNDGKTVWSAP